MTTDHRPVVGLDPGTKCGWAVRYDALRVDHGVWDCGGQQHQGAGMRWVILRRNLRELLERVEPQALGYELVVRTHRSTASAQVYGGVKAVVEEECENLVVPYQGVNVTLVKQLATGRGSGKGTSKADVRAAAIKRWGYGPSGKMTEDEADALWVAETLAVHLRLT